MKPNNLYSWEIETADGAVLGQYDADGVEQSWKTIDANSVVRVSFIPAVPMLPRHDVIIDASAGERFVKRFGRGFIRQSEAGFQLHEYLNCVETSRYRLYVFSTTGRTMVTRPDYEVYL